MKQQPLFYRLVVQGLVLWGLTFGMLLKADEDAPQFPSPTAEQLKVIQENSLSLLQNIAPAGSSGRKLKTMAIDGGLVYWGNLFDSNEVVALVNLAPEKPAGDGEESSNYWRECWPCYLSLCVWEKNHWVYRQYLDNAHTLVFHDRKDSPNHFVQASRKTGRYDGDFLSWYYDPKTKMLVRTNYESWGPFFLSGNYLCTTRGIERRAMECTVWVYAYEKGKKGDLLAAYDSNAGTGEETHFSITFRDRETKKLWTYIFRTEEIDSPSPKYTMDAVEGEIGEKAESPDSRVHYSGEMRLNEGDGGEDQSLDSFCFERLTGLSSAFVDAGVEGEADWDETPSKKPPVKPIKFEITGDPEIVRHLKNK